jgi:hypothetical protein
LKIKTITTWNKKLFEAYAWRFDKTYNWPFELKVYNEDEGMLDEIPDLKTFIDRNKHRQPQSDFGKKGLDFITDGVRFSYKVYAYTNAILFEEADGLICIDADSVFHKTIDVDWIKKHIHRDNMMMAYLGRGKHYSECGFLYFNLKHPDIKKFALRMREMYDEDLIYELKEQHDSYVWDYVRKEFEKEGIVNNNIGDGLPGHVQARSILGVVYDHTKGPRKLKGKSPEARI